MSAIASPYNLVAAASMPITSAAAGAFAAAAGVAQRGLASSSTALFGLDSHNSNNHGSGGSGGQPYYPPNPNLGGSLRDSYPLSMYGGGSGGNSGSYRRESASGTAAALHYHESRLANQYSDPSELQRLKV